MRLFVGVWPSDEVRQTIGRLPRPELRAVRWTTSQQWHVTLAFLGEVDAVAVEPLSDVLSRAVGGMEQPVRAVVGPATALLGAGVLCLPVSGLDELAAHVRKELAAVGISGERRDFQGHLTLARGRGGASLPEALVGTPAIGGWPVGSVDVIRSSLDPGGARYETVARATVPS